MSNDLLKNFVSTKQNHPKFRIKVIQGVQVQSESFISSTVFIPLVVRGCNIHFIIQKGGENDAQLLKL